MIERIVNIERVYCINMKLICDCLKKSNLYYLCKMEGSEDSISKIDGVIADIRMINLHFYNYIAGSRREDSKE